MIKPRSAPTDIESAFNPKKDPRYRADGTNYGEILAGIARRLAVCGDSVAADVAGRSHIDMEVRLAAVRVLRDPVTISGVAAWASTSGSEEEALAVGALERLARSIGLAKDVRDRKDIQSMLEIVAMYGTSKAAISAIGMIEDMGFLSLRIIEEKRPDVLEAAMRRRRVLNFVPKRRD